MIASNVIVNHLRVPIKNHMDMTVIEHAKNLLDAKRFPDLVEHLRGKKTWVFADDEQELMEAMLNSDSRSAVRFAAFIIGEHSQNAENLMPLIFKLSAQPSKSNAFSTLGEQGRHLFINTLSHPQIRWNSSYSSRMIECLADLHSYCRIRALEVLLQRFDEMFPDIFGKFSGMEFSNMEEALIYIENIALTVDKHHEFDDFIDVYQINKRVAYLLRFAITSQSAPVRSLREMFLDDDTFIFERICFNMRWTAYRKRLNLTY